MMIGMVIFLRITLFILISLRRYSQGEDNIYVALVSPDHEAAELFLGAQGTRSLHGFLLRPAAKHEAVEGGVFA